MYVTDPVRVARQLGITNPTDEQLLVISDAVMDAQADVEAFLNRSLIPQSRTLTQIYQLAGSEQTDWRAWPDARDFDDDYTVETVVDNGDDTFDVTFKVGLDGARTAPVERYVRAHALEALRASSELSTMLGIERAVKSVAAEGQSVTFADRPAAAGSAGTLPTLDQLLAYRRQSIYRSPRAPRPLWPNAGSGVLWL